MRRSFLLRASAFVVLTGAIAGSFAACGADVFTSAKADGGGAATDGATADESRVADGTVPDAIALGDAPQRSPCAPSKPFAAVTQVAAGVNTDVSETSFRTSPDDLVALVVRSHQNLYQYVRGSTGVDFSGNGTSIGAGGDVDHLTVTGDGSRVYFASTRTGSPTGLWTAARDTTTGALTSVSPVTVVPVTVNTLPDTLTDPYVTRDGKELLFAGKNAANDDDLWMADILSMPATFGNARPLTSVNTSYDEGDPVLSDDGLALYWAVTNSADVVSLATRPSTATDAFVVQAFPGGGVNAAAVSNTPMAISPDQCELYILSDRPGTLGGKDVWRATR